MGKWLICKSKNKEKGESVKNKLHPETAKCQFHEEYILMGFRTTCSDPSNRTTALKNTQGYTATQWQAIVAKFNLICQKQHFPAILRLIVQMYVFYCLNKLSQQHRHCIMALSSPTIVRPTWRDEEGSPQLLVPRHVSDLPRHID